MTCCVYVEIKKMSYSYLFVSLRSTWADQRVIFQSDWTVWSILRKLLFGIINKHICNIIQYYIFAVCMYYVSSENTVTQSLSETHDQSRIPVYMYTCTWQTGIGFPARRCSIAVNVYVVKVFPLFQTYIFKSSGNSVFSLEGRSGTPPPSPENQNS